VSAPAWTPGPWFCEETTRNTTNVVAELADDNIAWSITALVPASFENAKPDACLIAAAPDLAETGAAYWAAVDAKREFEREHPNNSTKAWDNLLYAVGDAETAHRAALAKAHGQ
jgi:hypothetical protein